ncbi:hypothetical protein G114_03322 [Aeromonas diversa CDC 2478-85]|uniref:Lcl C-terminal domain-containing protein n=1 Tax=Aeromonas diversa CDC 2478-85 TaxID=1268237 RepID=N9VP57_9GAMM|nr:DUF1566 domain-containing protein [Aeromonas diversa]ENY73343.1 hypothetical protein G114_03322 [Aeromonas diversa CDC 2478-85]
MRYPICVLATLCVQLTGCGGAEDSAPLTAPDYRVHVTVPTGGTLCVDQDQNWQCGAGEPIVTGSGRLTLIGSHSSLLTSPLLFIPAGASPLLHPAAMRDGLELAPGVLTTLLQSRIAQGRSTEQALRSLQDDLAPLAPGEGIGALSAFPEFESALSALGADALRRYHPRAEGAAPFAALYRALSDALPALSRQWQEQASLEGALPRLQALLDLQQPEETLTVTGVTTYADGVSALLGEEPADYPGQDASWSQARAPLSYRKLAADGSPLPADAKTWQCVEDLRTRLVWEVKSSDPRSPAWSGRPFVYADSRHPATSGERNEITTKVIDEQIAQWNAEGLETSEIEATLRSAVTTEEYVRWFNARQPCGIKRWRLPTFGELSSLLHLGSLSRDAAGEAITIDTRFFPDVTPSYLGYNDGAYWSSTLSLARVLENTPVSAQNVTFYGEDAGVAGTTAIGSQEFGIEPLLIRLVAEVTP